MSVYFDYRDSVVLLVMGILMNVLSLFDGKSSGYTALELIGITPTHYYSAEIDKYAIKVSNAIHPNQTRLGDVTKWREWDIDWSSIDLILGGFPCQAWSMAGKQMGDKDERGMLFWTMLDIMKEVRKHNPNADFLIENVKMKNEFEEYITHHTEQALGEVHKILINSALVSAQNRNRYYWTSWENCQPEDRSVLLADIIEKNGNFITLEDSTYTDRCKKQIIKNSKRSNQKSVAVCTNSNMTGSGVNVLAEYISTGQTVDGESFDQWYERNNKYGGSRKEFDELAVQKDNRIEFREKSKTVRSGGVGSPADSRHNWDNALDSKVHYRKLNPRECFRLQTVPEHYIDKILSCGVSNTQLYKIAGNGWTDEVIAHLLNYKYGNKND